MGCEMDSAIAVITLKPRKTDPREKDGGCRPCFSRATAAAAGEDLSDMHVQGRRGMTRPASRIRRSSHIVLLGRPASIHLHWTGRPMASIEE